MPTRPHRCVVPLALLALSCVAALPALAQWPADGLRIAPTSTGQNAPLAVTDGGAPNEGGSGVIVVWQETRGASGIDLYAQHVLVDGSIAPGWPATGLPVCTANATQTSAVAIPDGAGGAFVAWRDFRSGGPTSTDIYAQHVTAGGSIAPGWPANGLALCTAEGGQRWPALAPDGAGGALAAWMDQRGGASPDIFVQHVNGDGTLAYGWPVDGLPAFNHGEIGVPQPEQPVTAASDGAGGIIMLWTYYGVGYYDLRGQRMDGAGNRVWGDLAIEVATGYGFQYGGVPVPDGAGGVLFVYQDTGTNYPYDDIFAQRLGANGNPAPGWPSTTYGLPVCMAPDEQVAPAVVGDGAGGGFFSWKDSRAGAGNEDVYLQHVLGDATRAPGWPGNGLMVCAAPGAQLAPALVRDAWDGVIVAWQDARGGGDDIYAVRIAGDGSVVPGWGTPAEGGSGGTPVCTATGDQIVPAMVSDGAGGALVVWQDARSGTPAIYAQRVSDGGIVAPVAGVPPPASPAPRLALAPRPNPAGSALSAAFSLPDGAPARLELLDLSGRRLLAREVGTLGAGEHVLILHEADLLRAGVYLLRLTRGGLSVTARAVVLR